MIMNKLRSRICPLFFLILVLLLAGCTNRHTTLESFLDTPKHHASNGFSFLHRGQISDAEREFQSALRLDPFFSQAHCGLGLIAGMREEYDTAFKSMALARDYAKTEKDRLMVAVGEMRLYTMRKKGKWLDRVESLFEEAQKSQKGSAEAYYYLGEAYRQAYRFEKAEKAFKKVLALNSGLFWQANRQSRLIGKILKAMPASVAGKGIALKESLTRADVAVLIVEELKLDKIYQDLAHQTKGFHLPQELLDSSKLTPLPADVKAHPLRKDIENVLQLGVHGLELFADGSFRPEQPVCRAEYAVILAGIVSEIRNGPALNTQFSEAESPFVDIVNDDPHFSAVMLCTGKMNIMGPRQGVFNPGGDISGADALMALQNLKRALDIH